MSLSSTSSSSVVAPISDLDDLSSSTVSSPVVAHMSDLDDLSSPTSTSSSIAGPMGDMSISSPTAVETPSSTSAMAPGSNYNEEQNGTELLIQSKFVTFEGIFKETIGVWNSRIRELLGNFDARFPRGEIRDLRKSDEYILAMEKLALDLKVQKLKGLELKERNFDAFKDMKKEVLKSLQVGPKRDSIFWSKFQKCKEKSDDVKAVLSNLETITRNLEYYAKKIRKEKPEKALITNPKMNMLLLDWDDSFVLLNPNPRNMEIELKLGELN